MPMRSRRARREEQLWLREEPAPIVVPERVTHAWLATHAPGLHPTQVAQLRRELEQRGWTSERITVFVGPYLRQNPYLRRDRPPL